MIEETKEAAPVKPLAELQTIYFANREDAKFFKQNSPSGGTYLEVWSEGKDFTHILTTVELGDKDQLAIWFKDHKLLPSDQDVYEAAFFHLCNQVADKKERKLDERRIRIENQKINDNGAI